MEYNQNDIEFVLSQAREYNSEIGYYERHMTDQNDFNCSVKLNNGFIKLTTEEIQDKESLDADRLKKIAERFRKN